VVLITTDGEISLSTHNGARTTNPSEKPNDNRKHEMPPVRYPYRDKMLRLCGQAQSSRETGQSS
jgi:hypothetical protein